MRIRLGPVRPHIVILAVLVLVQGGMAAPGCTPSDAVCETNLESVSHQTVGLVLLVTNATLAEVGDAADSANETDDATQAGQEAASNATTEIEGVVASQNSTTDPAAEAVRETAWDAVEPIYEAYRYAAENWPGQVNTPQVQTKYATVEGGAVDVPVGPTSLPVPPMAPPTAPPEGLIDTAIGAVIGPRSTESAAPEPVVHGGAPRADLGQASQPILASVASHVDPTDDDHRDDPRPADDIETTSSAVKADSALFDGILMPSIAAAMIAALFLAVWLVLRRTIPGRWLVGGPLATLFSRQTGSAVLRHPLRQAIHSTIQQQPGITQTKLATRIDVQPSTIRYHLHVLQREGQIQGRREGKVHHFYADPSLANANWKAPACLFLRRRAELAQAILSQPGANQQGIVRKTNIPASRVSSCVRDLISAGLVTSRREGRHCRYFPTSLLEEIGVNGDLVSRAMR